MAVLLAALILLIPLGLDLYVPVPEGNPLTTDKIATGRRLFNDRRLSRDRSIACFSCHDPARAFTDGRPVSIGVDGRLGKRSAPAIINRAYGRAFFWDGRAPTLEEQVLMPIADPNEMDLPTADAAARVGMSEEDMARALASYVRSILAGDSPYDRFVSGQRDAIATDQQRGLQIFRGKGNCSACHVGPTFTDERLHNTGIAWRNGRFIDDGGGNGSFKTPTLREVSRTAPYMHDGSVATLEEVVEYYDSGGRGNPWLDRDIMPLGLSSGDKRDLVAFLHALSGEVSEGLQVVSRSR